MTTEQTAEEQEADYPRDVPPAADVGLSLEVIKREIEEVRRSALHMGEQAEFYDGKGQQWEWFEEGVLAVAEALGVELDEP